MRIGFLGVSLLLVVFAFHSWGDLPELVLETSRYQHRACAEAIERFDTDIVPISDRYIIEKVPIGNGKFLYQTATGIYMRVDPDDSRPMSTHIYRLVLSVEKREEGLLYLDPSRIPAFDGVGEIQKVLWLRDKDWAKAGNRKGKAAIINTNGDIFVTEVERNAVPYWHWDNAQELFIPIERHGFSGRAALLNANAARLAYDPFETEGDEIITSQLEGGPWRLVKSFNVKTSDKVDTQALLLYRDDIRLAVLAIRGTAGLRDLITDMRVHIKWTEHGRMHQGFWAAWQVLYFPLTQALLQLHEEILAKNGKGAFRLFITGHSLGGAVATVGTQQIDRMLKSRRDEGDVLRGRLNLLAGYTFGSPRIGMGEMDFKIEPPIHRIIRPGDPVPYMPPLIFFPHYEHAGSLYELRPDTGRFHRSPGSPARWARWTLRAIMHPKRVVMFQEHSMVEYVGDLADIVAYRNPEWIPHRPIPLDRSRVESVPIEHD